MISNRFFTVVFFALISAIVLHITAQHLDHWESASGHYYTGDSSPHFVVNTNGTATTSLVSASAG